MIRQRMYALKGDGVLERWTLGTPRVPLSCHLSSNLFDLIKRARNWELGHSSPGSSCCFQPCFAYLPKFACDLEFRRSCSIRRVTYFHYKSVEQKVAEELGFTLVPTPRFSRHERRTNSGSEKRSSASYFHFLRYFCKAVFYGYNRNAICSI